MTKVTYKLNLDHESGFTLVELIVAIAIFGIIAIGVMALVSNVLLNSSRQGTGLANQDQARKAAFGIVNELRNATYGATGAYPLEQAGAQQLIMYSNADNDAAIERIRYVIQNGTLQKGITQPTGNPPTYNLGQEQVTTIQDNVGNGANPLFYYYDGTHNGTVDNFLAQPVNVTQVKLVRVNLMVYQKAGVSNNTTYTLSASGSIRNLKTNLGD